MYCIACGKEIDDDTKFCKYCGENIKKASGLPKVKIIYSEFFILFCIFTCGIYQFLWLIRRYKALNALSQSKYNNISWVMLLACFIVTISEPFYFVDVMRGGNTLPNYLYIITAPAWWCMPILTVKIIRIIEDYTLLNRGKIIRHNIVAMILFCLIYVNYAIETYNERLNKGLDIKSVDPTVHGNK